MSSRIAAAVAVSMLCVSGCSGPGNGPTTPQTISQNDAAVSQSVVSPSASRELFWRPGHLVLQKGEKKSAKLFFRAGLTVAIADTCTGRVALDEIGIARIRKYRINVYDVVALHSGPFRCGVLAKTQGSPELRAVLHIAVKP